MGWSRLKSTEVKHYERHLRPGLAASRTLSTASWIANPHPEPRMPSSTAVLGISVRGRSQAVLYNRVRPHAALGYKPPAPEVFVPALAAWPAALPRTAPPATLAPKPTLN